MSFQDPSTNSFGYHYFLLKVDRRTDLVTKNAEQQAGRRLQNRHLMLFAIHMVRDWQRRVIQKQSHTKGYLWLPRAVVNSGLTQHPCLVLQALEFRKWLFVVNAES